MVAHDTTSAHIPGQGKAHIWAIILISEQEAIPLPEADIPELRALLLDEDFFRDHYHLFIEQRY